MKKTRKAKSVKLENDFIQKLNIVQDPEVLKKMDLEERVDNLLKRLKYLTFINPNISKKMKKKILVD